MSCITELLKIKGDKKYLVKDTLAIEDGGIYKGYEYLVTFVVTMPHRCGYVAISRDHPLYDIDLMSCDDAPELNVHGGITFNQSGKHIINRFIDKFHCEDKWIGFDAMHCDDQCDFDSANDIFKDDIQIMKKIDSYKDAMNYPFLSENWNTIKDKNYMIEECKNLIDQLIII